MHKVESQHQEIGQASLEPLLDFVWALGHNEEITALIYNVIDAINKDSSLKKTFLKQSYYQFSHCF